MIEDIEVKKINNDITRLKRQIQSVQPGESIIFDRAVTKDDLKEGKHAYAHIPANSEGEDSPVDDSGDPIDEYRLYWRKNNQLIKFVGIIVTEGGI